MAILFVENPLNKPEVNHIMGVKHDNRASQLEWVTRGENIMHSARVLGNFCGTKSGRSKFTDEQVIKIFNTVGTHRQIAKEYEVSHSVVGFIKRKVSYTSETKILNNDHLFNSTITRSIVIGVYDAVGSYKKIANDFKVSVSTVFLIKHGKLYQKITGGKKKANTNRVLSDDIALLIRESKESRRVLSERYGVSLSLIKGIKAKRNYSWI